LNERVFVDQEKIEQGVRLILEGIGEDPDREGLKKTPGRVARMYAEICSGRQSRIPRTVASSIRESIPPTPKITSTLTLSNPASRSCRNARRAPSESCLRFIQRSIPSSSDCTPILTLFTPSARSPAAYSGVMSSGFTSTVHSL
jgi:hypothetical protein